MSGQRNWALKFICALIISVVLGSQFLLVQPAAAQAPTDWTIIVDSSISQGAIEGSVSSIQSDTDWVRGDIVVTNNKSLWWKVYVSVVGDVDIDTSNLFVDENGHYFLLAPRGSSATDALPRLPPSVTFHQPGSSIFFYADRTIESGFEALLLQVADIALIALTGSGVPTSVVELTLQTLQASPFVEAAYALGRADLWGAVGAISGIATDSVALEQLQYLLGQVGVSMTIQQIASVFSVLRIFEELVVMYDLFTSPFADNVAFQAVGPEDRPLIAVIECSPTSGVAPLVVSFDASDSYAPQYPIESYEWNFGDGGTATGVAPTHTYLEPGNYTVTLTVTDSQGRQSTAERSLAVSQPRIQVTGETEMFRLAFEAEDSPVVLSYSWDFGDGSAAKGRVVEHTYASAGEYVVILAFGLDTGDPTRHWVPWVAWDMIKVTLEEDSSPTGWSFSVDRYDDAPETIAVDGIIVEDADEVWTNSLQYSADLVNVAREVGPRIIVEYGNSIFERGLQGSEDLNRAAATVSPRIIVEYGDSIFGHGLQGSEDLNGAAATVSPRIIVEYGNSTFGDDLYRSDELDQAASIVISRTIVEYANSIFSAHLQRPSFLSTDQPPSVGTFEPDGGSGTISQTVVFTTTYFDPNGHEDIKLAFFFLDRAPPIASGGLAAAYIHPANILWLKDGGICRPGQAKSLSTAYITLDCSNSSVSGAGGTLTINWHVHPEQCFVGGCGENTAYGFVIDGAGLRDVGAVGTWTLNPASGPAQETGPAVEPTEADLERLMEEIEAWQSQLGEP